MITLFHEVAQQCSKITTQKYSTSFCNAIQLLDPEIRVPIYNIYGFVRFADEIVDTFHDYNKAELLLEFKKETYKAIDRNISLNPILHSFQKTVKCYSIPLELIEGFFKSMEMDLGKTVYNSDSYKEYIYGSAEVVGLMCLYVFCGGDAGMFNELKPGARSLGAAFQKVNFLRDVKADYELLNRTYFPDIDFRNFTGYMKREIEADIEKDFRDAYKDIIRLPARAKFGVYVAYKYYLSLFNKIKRTTPSNILEQRIRIPRYGKIYILAKAGIRNQLNIL